jgi:hypothetical protein
MGEILEECVGDLEKCWWENGTPKLFFPIAAPREGGLEDRLHRSSTSVSAFTTRKTIFRTSCCFEDSRRHFKRLPTSFKLDPIEVDQLRAVGKKLLEESFEYQRLLKDLR